MKKTLLLVLLLPLATLAGARGIYIVNSLYQRPLAATDDGTQARLIAYDAARDARYRWDVEETDNPSYVRLRNAATGAYLAAKTGNDYAVALEAAPAGESALWLLRTGLTATLESKKNSGTRLGVDTGETSEAIGVWRDKTNAAATAFELFEANGEGLDASRKAWAEGELTAVARTIQTEVAYTKYPILLRSRLARAADDALAWEGRTADESLRRAQELTDSLALLTAPETAVLLTESEMDRLTGLYTLALGQAKVAEGDSLYILLRQRDGRGLRYTLRESGDVALAVDQRLARVYINKVKVDSLPLTHQPPLTAQGTEAEWSIVRKSMLKGGVPEVASTSALTCEPSAPEVDALGRRTKTVMSLTGAAVVVGEAYDLHLSSPDAPLTRSTVDLADPAAWLVFDRVRPSQVIADYLPQVRVAGRVAREGVNCRVAIYLEGAAVIPATAGEAALTLYTGQMLAGEATSYATGRHKSLGEQANTARSMLLRRGYMATLATDDDGRGYSRVYVADHADLRLDVLPEPLEGRVSSVVVRPWQYVGKKGWCSTKGTDAIAADCEKLHATWFYTWGADRNSTPDIEYVPIRQHIYWPSISAIESRDATACLSINEPEHSEQHADCDCKGTISEWTACTLTPDFQSSGLRIGSPAPTADGWLTTYINHCNDMQYRCDFVAIHAYWGSNEAADANAWYNRLKAIHEATSRPIWITEWAYGASWTKESWPSGWDEKLEENRRRVKAIQQKLEEAPFVERYAYYQWDTQYRNLVDWSDGHTTPAGRAYRDRPTNFAYRADQQFTPVYWRPSLKRPAVSVAIEKADEAVVVSIDNANGDLTESLTLQRLDEATGEWTTLLTDTARPRFDSPTLTYTLPLATGTRLRAVARRLTGDEATSETCVVSYIKNPECLGGTAGWEATNVETAHGEAYDNEPDNWYWNLWKGSPFTATLTQSVAHLPSGRYTLSCMARGSTNETLTLSAQATGHEALTATAQGQGNGATDRYPNGWLRLATPEVEVGEGESLILTFQATNATGAAWYSADHFTLERKGDGLDAPASASAKGATAVYDLQGRRLTKAPQRGLYIEKGKKRMAPVWSAGFQACDERSE